MIGQQVQQFTIVEKLGQGGMGEVYLADDSRLKRKVALKFLPAHISADPEFKSRFEHEATAAAALNHPNIITVYELGEYEGKPFIAMEYLEGQALDEYIKSQDINIETATRIAGQAIEGLAAAHEAGIVHRDIKPGNIFIDKAGRVKVLDFGLAKSRRATTDTQAGTTVGTVQYESPEQGRGDQVDGRSDLFSLGVVLYEMVAGQLPFKGEFTDAIRYATANETPDPLARYKADVPDELQRIVGRLLEKDPELRYQTASGVISDLKLLQRDSGSSVTSAYRPATPGSGSPPRQLAKILIPGVLVAIALVVVFVLKPWKLEISPSQDAVAAQNRLAVMYFNNVTDPDDSERLGEIATNLLITDLSQSEGVQVVSSQRLYDLLQQLGHTGSRSVTQDMASRVAEKAEARWMLTGSILRMEPIVLTAQLVETASGDNVGSHRVNGAEGEDIFVLVDRLSDEVRGHLSIPASASAETDRAVADVTTHSTEAFRHYLAGRELQNKLFHSEAAEEYRRAVAADSTFAMAYYKLVQVGSGAIEERKHYMEMACAHSGNASELEQMYINGMRLLRDEQNDSATELYRELVEQYPDDKTGYRQLSALMGEEYGDDSSIYYLERVAEIDPLDKLVHNELAYAYNRQDQFEKSIQSINRYLELAPDEPNPLDSRGDLYAYNGHYQEAVDSYRRALEIKSDYFVSLRKLGDMYLLMLDRERAESCYTELTTSNDRDVRAEGRTRLAAIPAYHGELADAMQLLDDGLAADRLEKAVVAPLLKLISQSIISWVRSDFDRAVEAGWTAQEMLAKFEPKDPDQLRCFIAFMEYSRDGHAAGDSLLGDARQRFADVGTPESADFLDGEAMCLVARADYAGALDRWGQIVENDPTTDPSENYFRAIACIETGEIGEAVAILENLTSEYDEEAMVGPPLIALYHYQLARAYEKSGWTRKAIEKYQFFVDLWADADEGLEALEDARARLAALQS